MANIDDIAKLIGKYSIANDAPAVGQNLFKPSYIGGLGKELVQSDGITPKNPESFDTTNSELTTAGYCIGRMIQGYNTIHIVKQQDFLYLAIDQFINSLCNTISKPPEELGEYIVICMISDWPYEGVQARSNNNALFASIGNYMDVNFCDSAQSLAVSLNSTRKGAKLIFISSEYTYKSKNIEWDCNQSTYNSISISLNNCIPKVNLLIGFIPKKLQEKMSPDNYISVIDITSDSFVKDIIAVIIRRWGHNPVEIIIHEASTSKISLAYEIGWKLKEQADLLSIQIQSTNLGSVNKIGLINQAKY